MILVAALAAAIVSTPAPTPPPEPIAGADAGKLILASPPCGAKEASTICTSWAVMPCPPRYVLPLTTKAPTVYARPVVPIGCPVGRDVYP